MEMETGPRLCPWAAGILGGGGTHMTVVSAMTGDTVLWESGEG